MRSNTGLLENLALVYKSYGGFRVFITSGYTILSAIITLAIWPSVVDGEWTTVSLGVLPTLAGFSIAAYAVFFSVLSASDQTKLKQPDQRLGGRSPLLILASSVSHAVFIQVLGLLSAIVFKAKPFPSNPWFPKLDQYINILFSSFGSFLMIYGIMLVLASVLSIFRILEIKARV